MRTQRTQIIIYCKVITTISDSYIFFSSNVQCSMPSLDYSNLHSNRNHFVCQGFERYLHQNVTIAPIRNHVYYFKTIIDEWNRSLCLSLHTPNWWQEMEKKRRKKKIIKFNCSNVTKYLDFLWLKWKDIKTVSFGLRSEGIFDMYLDSNSKIRTIEKSSQLKCHLSPSNRSLRLIIQSDVDSFCFCF